VRAIEIVTADGELRRVTADSEPNLALRGGKGNFGVVTALEFSLFPVTSVYGGGLVFAGEDAVEVLHTWREWVVDLPEEITSSVAFLRWPPMPTVPEPLRGGRDILAVLSARDNDPWRCCRVGANALELTHWTMEVDR